MTGVLPATSPFRVKGIAYRGALAYYARVVPGGVSALANATSDAELRQFITQPFLASGWYDVTPFPAIDALGARLCGQSLAQFVRGASRAQAREELGGIYRMFLKLLSPATVGQYLPRLAAQYYDFGTVSTEQDSASSIVVTRSGVPADLGEWLQAVALEYLAVALELSGAEGVQIRPLGRKPDGHVAGHALCRMQARIEWR